MTAIKIQNCPCCSGRKFENCCQPIIENRSAPTALALMKSRYVAYTMANASYLLETTSPSKQSNYDKTDLKNWAVQNQWTKLEIVAAEHGKINDVRGIVEFKAHFVDQSGMQQMHHERSNFEKIEDKWYYVDGAFNPQETELVKKASRNDPCPCGSGKKYKKCCG